MAMYSLFAVIVLGTAMLRESNTMRRIAVTYFRLVHTNFQAVIPPGFVLTIAGKYITE